MKKVFGESFFRDVVRIAVPVSLQSMLQSSFAMVDQMMVGQLGSTAVAAVEVASRPGFIYSVVAGAAASVAGIMISQYLGMEEEEMADRSLWVNLTATVVIAALFTLACVGLPRQIVGIYIGDDREILEAGREYLVRAAWTYVPMGVSMVLSVMVRCLDRAVWSLWAGMAAAVVNTGLNYVLIFGRLGFPALGVAGAATASVISQVVNVLLIAAAFFGVRLRKESGMNFSLNLGAEGYCQFGRMLLPVLVNEFLWSVGQNVNTFIYGHLGKGELAAMSMTGPVQGLFMGALQGVSQAAGILIGRRLGAGEYDKAYEESKRLMWYGFACSLALAAGLIGLRGVYGGLYHVEKDVQRTASALLLVFSFLSPVKVANMILGGGIVRSGGNTAYIMVIDMVGTWLVGVPLGLISAFVFRLPIVWVYFILSQEEMVRLLLTLAVFRGRKWMASLCA